MRKLFLSIAMVLGGFMVHGQELPEIIPQSPEAAAFTKYKGDLNLFEGKPTINIPIHTLQAGSISLPVSLSYNAGVKVNQVASDVGLGWNLNMGGVVSRTVNGLPDGEVNGSNYTKVTNSQVQSILSFYRGGNSTRIFTSSQGKRQELVNMFKDYEKGNLDLEYDTFSFSVNGLSGTIVTHYNRGDVYCIEDPTLKIEYKTLRNDTDIKEWIITDVKGIQYTFSQYEYTSTAVSSLSGDEFGYEYISSWYLSNVRHNNNEIVFNYIPGVSWSQEMPLRKVRERKEEKNCDNSSYYISTTTKSLETPTYTIRQPKVYEIEVNGIKQLGLTYNSRNDLSGGSRVSKISVFHQNESTRKLKSFQLEQSYFNNGDNSTPSIISGTSTDNLRLKLDELRIYENYSYGAGSSTGDGVITADTSTNGDYQAYTFSYIRPNELPSRTSDKYDFLGYYNNFGIEGSTSFSNAIIGSLNRIEYPTGGSSEFFYEEGLGAFRVKKIIDNSVDNGSFTKYYYYNDLSKYLIEEEPSVDPDPVVEDISFSEFLSSVKGIRPINNEDIIIGNDGTYLTWSGANILVENINNYWVAADAYTITLPGIGTSNVVNINRGDFPVSVNGSASSISQNWLSYDSLHAEYLQYIEDQRVDPVPPEDPLTIEEKLQLVIGDFNYHTTAALHQKRNIFKSLRGFTYYDDGRGGGGLNVGDDIVEDNHPDQPIVNPQDSDPQSRAASTSTTNPNDCQSYRIEQTFNYNLFSKQKIDVGYSTVTEIIYKDYDTFSGFNVYSFYNSENNRIAGAEENAPIIVPTIDGRLKSVKTYNKDNQIVQYKHSEYTREIIGDEDDIEINGYTLKLTNTYNNVCESYATDPEGYAYGYSFPQNGICPLGLPTSMSNYYANTYKYRKFFISLNKEVQVDFYRNSSNEVNEVISETAYSYENPDHYQTTKTTAKNSKGETLITETKYVYDGSGDLLLDTADNSGKYAPPGVNPQEITTSKKEGDTVTELSKQYFVYDRFEGLNLLEKVQTSKGGSDLEDRIKYHSYNDRGNPTEVSKQDGTHIVYIWGYNASQPVAKIENATLSEIPLSYITTIQEASDLDTDTTQGNTGKEGELRAALNSLRSLATLQDAQVTTFTYNPLIGVTSVTDPRGEVIYYEYDNFNRLHFIKDASGNLIKEHRYNYKN
ncbi:RHS repeat protein [Tenacibaculum sp. M341]|uniref:RHS repeat protein n=1 Tax=Tenacibaculum sp. M341 TaxID=2530339 RepID=UPI001043E70B|nr:RHS repeat protein [Tenacibaculum sp. M341]TCI85062.1 hypothetical protein EYW44_18750 [Tenacibaculum sp. M341]